jgi:hypothetical protein
MKIYKPSNFYLKKINKSYCYVIYLDGKQYTRSLKIKVDETKRIPELNKKLKYLDELKTFERNDELKAILFKKEIAKKQIVRTLRDLFDLAKTDFLKQTTKGNIDQYLYNPEFRLLYIRQ